MGGYVNWRYVITDLSGNNLGEVLDRLESKVTRKLSAPSTASFTVPVTSPLLPYLLEYDLYMKAYRNDALMFHGPVITAELGVDNETGTPTVACGATDPFWRLDKRVSGKSAKGTLYNGVDRLTIAETLINNQNSTSETGIRTLGQTCGSTSVYISGPYKQTSECVAELGNTLAGFDWRMDPIEYDAGKIGEFTAGATLGSIQQSAVFEYQGRGNVRVPNYQRGIVDLVNKVYSIPDDGPASNLGVRTAQDTTSQADRGLYEEVIDTSNITNSTLRDAVLNDHIAFRKRPRQVLTFSPDFSDYSGRVPEYGTDYQVADTVRARVKYGPATLVDGYVRLYSMQFEIDQNGKETLTPTVVQEDTG